MLDKVRQSYSVLRQSFCISEYDIPMLRCVLSVTLALVVSTTFGHLMPHFCAVLALLLLEANPKPFGLKKEIAIFLAIGIIGYFGVMLGYYLIDYPLVILPILGLIIFWSFRLIKIPQPVRLLVLILSILIPFLCMKANLLGGYVLKELLLNLVIALVAVRIGFFVFPFTSEKQTNEEKEKTINYKNINLDKLAFNGLLVIFPLVSVFYLFNSVATLILVFALILSFDPFVYQSKKGFGLLLANVIGGSIGILVYNILVIAPSFTLYIFLVLTVGLYIVPHIFSDKKTAPLFKISFNIFFVTMGIISTTTNEAGTAIWERLIQIGLAVLYVIVVFKIVNTFNNPKLTND